jgi:hypothetical protein
MTERSTSQIPYIDMCRQTPRNVPRFDDCCNVGLASCPMPFWQFCLARSRFWVSICFNKLICTTSTDWARTECHLHYLQTTPADPEPRRRRGLHSRLIFCTIQYVLPFRTRANNRERTQAQQTLVPVSTWTKSSFPRQIQIFPAPRTSNVTSTIPAI